MTGPHDNTPARREGDRGRLGRVQAWWRRWGQLVMGGSVLALAIATFVIGLELRHYSKSRARDTAIVLVIAKQQQAQQKATAASARLQCLRSKAYGPALADYYERQHVLPMDVIAAYRRTIPKTCPK